MASLRKVRQLAFEAMKASGTCTCDTPCCEVDIGIGFVNCGAQHCPEHASPENQGVPAYSSYQDGPFYARDTVNGQPTGAPPHRVNRISD